MVNDVDNSETRKCKTANAYMVQTRRSARKMGTKKQNLNQYLFYMLTSNSAVPYETL